MRPPNDVVHIRGVYGCGKQSRSDAHLVDPLDAIEPHRQLKWKWRDDLCSQCATKALPAFNALVSARAHGGELAAESMPEQMTIFDALEAK